MLLIAGCWGTPQLLVRTAATSQGDFFTFGYCRGDGPAPPLSNITVSSIDGPTGSATVCELQLKPNGGTMPVAHWTYGAELPTLQRRSTCDLLERGRRYRISIFGGGMGGEVFTVSREGRLVSEGMSCHASRP
jgi:hypothetical protein